MNYVLYRKKKNKVRLIYAYDRETGEIVSFVCGKRDLKTVESRRTDVFPSGLLEKQPASGISHTLFSYGSEAVQQLIFSKLRGFIEK
jgi:hypothetical protein